MNCPKRLEELDKNFSFESALDKEGLVFHDARKAPFVLHGFDEPQDTAQALHRMPPAVAETVSEGVKAMNFWCAGGRVRFATNSPYIAIRCETIAPISLISVVPLALCAGFDIYEESETGELIFHGALIAAPDRVGKVGYEAVRDLPKDGKMRQYILNFPCYGSVKNLAIGLHCDARLASGAPYRYPKPLVFYGSSITMGGCASRPGACYEALLSAEYGFDYINLGFAGNAKGEPEMAEYLASLDPSVFICDYDYNAPSAEHLLATLPPLYRAFREAHPETPFIFVSSPEMKTGKERHDIVQNTAREAIESGDKNVYFVDGAHMFDEMKPHACTIEGCHPTDLGFYCMAKAIGRVLGPILKKI